MSNLDILHVALGLHWYQPYTQKKEVLKQIISESYIPILNSIERRCLGTVSCDISASLIFQLMEAAPEVLKKIIRLKNRGKIALVNTAAYHPILPLMPEDYIRRQLMLNENAYRQAGLLQENEKLSGVFPPEMAYSDVLTAPISKMGYSWTITDDLPFNCLYKMPTPATWVANSGGLPCLLRSRLWSGEMSFNMPDGKTFVEKLGTEFEKQFSENIYQAYLVLWTDAETFGAHHKNAVDRFLEPFFAAVKKSKISLVSCDSLLKLYPTKKIAVPAGSWSSDPPNLAAIPFNLWEYPCEWHALWWELAHIVQKIAKKNPEARELSDKVLYSCQTWWWSLYKKNDLFLWAVPDFQKILELGTASDRSRGKDIISKLS